MSSKNQKIVYRIATGILTIIILMFVANNLFNHELFSKRFVSLGHPGYLILPLTVAKVLGLVAIWSNKSALLKEWAYAGFLFVFILAFLAEVNAADGEVFSSSIALISLIVSRMMWSVQIKTQTT
ncbi:MAG: DoxX family protein [Bacteroidota bacterium]